MVNGKQQETKMSDKTKRRNIVLIILIIISIFSTLVVLILLGSLSTPDYLGKIIDTIPLKPKDQTDTVIHLSGRVLYSDGTPAAGKTLVLHSEPRYTISDKYGYFFYPGLISGEHTVTVLNNDGSVAGMCNVEIIQNKENTDTVFTQNDKGTDIELNVNLRVLEVEVELNPEAGTLEIDGASHSELLKNGQVRTPTGIADISNGTVVSPGGMIFMPDGSVIIPSDGNTPTVVIASDDTVTYIEVETTLDNGTKIDSDGEIQLNDGTTINNGKIKTADGDEKTPGEGGVQIIIPSSADKPTDVIPIGEDTGKLTVFDKNNSGEFISWSQGNTIELFYNRTAGINSHEKVAPGSAGYYLFRLDNTRTRELAISITLEETGSVHLPLLVKLTPLDDKGNKLTEKTVTVTFPDSSLTLDDTVASGTSTVYLLEWEWPFDGNDELDTKLGNESEEYTLSLEIYAEEK